MPWFVLYPVEPVDAPRGTGNFNSTVIVFLGNVFFNTGARAFDELWVYWEFIGGGVRSIHDSDLPFLRIPPAARVRGRQRADTGRVFVGKSFARRDARIECVDPERVETELFPGGLMNVDEDLTLAARQRFVLMTITVGTFVRDVTVNRFPGILVLESNDLVLECIDAVSVYRDRVDHYRRGPELDAGRVLLESSPRGTERPAVHRRERFKCPRASREQ